MLDTTHRELDWTQYPHVTSVTPRTSHVTTQYPKVTPGTLSWDLPFTLDPFLVIGGHSKQTNDTCDKAEQV